MTHCDAVGGVKKNHPLVNGQLSTATGLGQFQDHMGIMMQENIEFLYFLRRIALYIFPLISRQDTFCMMEPAFTRCFDIYPDSPIISHAGMADFRFIGQSHIRIPHLLHRLS